MKRKFKNKRSIKERAARNAEDDVVRFEEAARGERRRGGEEEARGTRKRHLIAQGRPFHSIISSHGKYVWGRLPLPLPLPLLYWNAQLRRLS